MAISSPRGVPHVARDQWRVGCGSVESVARQWRAAASYVAPHFQGQIEVLEDNRNWIESNMGAVFAKTGQAQVKAFTDAGKELPEQMKQAMEALRKARA